MVPVNKPYPHEHAARLYEPSKLDAKTFKRTQGGSLYGGNVKVPASASVIWGKPKSGDHVVAQAIRFPTSNWTADKAKKWLKDNGVHATSFTAATGDTKKADTDVLVEAWDTLAADYQHSYEKKDRKGVVQSALMFKAVHDELTSREGVIVHKSQVPSVLSGFTIDQKDIRDGIDLRKLAGADGKTLFNLMVMDKEPTPVRGILRYTLGCIKDSTKPARDLNIVKACELNDFDTGAKLDEVVQVTTDEVGVEEADGFFLPVIKAASMVRPSKRLSIAKSRDVLRAAHDASVLDADREMMVKLAERKLFNINLDRQFGVNLVKEVRLIKGDMKNGVVYGVVYPVNEVDADGDYATPEEVQLACWRFMEDYQTMNLLHQQFLPSDNYAIVECACALGDFTINGNTIKKGDWYIAVKVKDPELRRMVESGELSAFSMEGSANPGDEIPSLESQKRRSA